MTVVIATIILFLAADWFTRRMREKQIISMQSPVAPTTSAAHPVRVPEGIFFAPSHTWLNLYHPASLKKRILGPSSFSVRESCPNGGHKRS